MGEDFTIAYLVLLLGIVNLPLGLCFKQRFCQSWRLTRGISPFPIFAASQAGLWLSSLNYLKSIDMTPTPKLWLALAIGNSRLHWASFMDHALQQTWQTRHINEAEGDQLITHNFDFQQCGLWPENFPPPNWAGSPELWVVSVVPEQGKIWQYYKNIKWITLAQLPIKDMYPTLGIDRAIALWGAIITYGSPVLVIDGGTALTLTGVQGNQFIGGAILPGLQLQFQALGQSTAALPWLTFSNILIEEMPPRWARDTPDAIASGVIHSVVAGIHSFIADWLQHFPNSHILFTGGDGSFLHHAMQSRFATKDLLKLDQQLMFWGMRSVRELSAGAVRP